MAQKASPQPLIAAPQLIFAAALCVVAGAVAGIVVGTTLGAGLTALIGWVAYREYQKRRLKRFYK
jgi:hypothetical protein